MIHPIWFKKITEKEKNILDLEKKYMAELYDIFNSVEFSEKLKLLIHSFNEDDLLTYSESPMAIPFERLIHFFIHRKYKNEIQGPYVSPISGDVAIELKECVLSIDAKTISHKSNPMDMGQLQCSGNQISFKNKIVYTPSFVASVEAKLAEEFEEKPVLSFFLVLNYTHRSGGDFRDLGFYSHKISKNMTLASVPNGILARYFSSDIIYGFKTYDKLNQKMIKVYGLYKSVSLPKKEFKELDLQQTIQYIKPYVDNNFFNNVTPKKCLDNSYIFICKRTNFRYRLRKQEGKVSFGPEDFGSIRIDFKRREPRSVHGLSQRFDQNGDRWDGCVHWDFAGQLKSQSKENNEKENK